MLYKQIKSELIDAMKAKDTLRLLVIRGLVASFTNELASPNHSPTDELSDEEVISIIKKAVKQRKDSIEQFEKGGRDDLVKSEKAELAILEKFLPTQMSREEIEKVVAKKKEELNVTDKSKIGILIGAVLKDLKGTADGKVVKEVAESLFN